MNTSPAIETHGTLSQMNADDKLTRLAELRQALEALGMTANKVDAIVAEVAHAGA